VEPTNGRDGQESAAIAAHGGGDASPGREQSGGSSDDRYWTQLIWRDATVDGAQAAIKAARESIFQRFEDEDTEAPRFSVSIRFTILPPRENEKG
jgi:hypothetical protein